MIKNATLLFLLFLAGYPAVSQQIDTAKLNKYFQVLERNNKLMGSVAIAEKDELIYQKAIGYADVQQKKRLI